MVKSTKGNSIHPRTKKEDTHVLRFDACRVRSAALFFCLEAGSFGEFPSSKLSCQVQCPVSPVPYFFFRARS